MEVIRVTVPHAQAELAADALWQARPTAVHELDEGTGVVALTADITEPANLDPAWSVERVDVNDDSHLDAWRAWARQVRVGRRTIVQPAWLPLSEPPDPDDIVLFIDPGRAFGSGAHTSTQQVLAALEEIDLVSCAVLDLGCGSGVLSVAAARHGARGVLAVDVDQAAIYATVENCAHNGVAVRVEGSLTPVAELRRTFDLVMANIGVRVLVDDAAAISRCVAAHGLLILAGFLESQIDEVTAAYPDLRVVRREVDDNWACLVLQPT